MCVRDEWRREIERRAPPPCFLRTRAFFPVKRERWGEPHKYRACVCMCVERGVRCVCARVCYLPVRVSHEKMES